MNTPPSPRILSADTIKGGALITFDDGKCAVFPAAFLYANLVHVQIVEPDDDE